MHTDLEAAWDELHAASPIGWFVGRPSFHDEADRWEQHAFDTTEKAVVGKRSREWTAAAQSEVGVVREMARCLRQIRAGRWPR